MSERQVCRERLEQQLLRVPADDVFREQLVRDLSDLQPKRPSGPRVASVRSSLTFSLRLSALAPTSAAPQQSRERPAAEPAAAQVSSSSCSASATAQRATRQSAGRQAAPESLVAHALQMLCGLAILLLCFVYATGLLLVGRLGLLPTLYPLVRLFGRLTASSAALQSLADTLARRPSFVVCVALRCPSSLLCLTLCSHLYYTHCPVAYCTARHLKFFDGHRTTACLSFSACFFDCYCYTVYCNDSVCLLVRVQSFVAVPLSTGSPITLFGRAPIIFLYPT